MTINAFFSVIRHLNPLKTHSERTKKADKKISELNFLSLEKIIVRLKRKIIVVLMCFVTKIIWFILFMYQIKNLKTDGFIVDNK